MRLGVIVGALVLALVGTACGSDSPAATAAPDQIRSEATSAPTTSPAAGAAASFEADHLDTGPRSGQQFVVLDKPRFVPAREVDWLAPDDVVMGAVAPTETIAFPVRQMAYHHIANTRLAGEPFVVTY